MHAIEMHAVKTRAKSTALEKFVEDLVSGVCHDIINHALGRDNNHILLWTSLIYGD